MAAATTTSRHDRPHRTGHRLLLTAIALAWSLSAFGCVAEASRSTTEPSEPSGAATGGASVDTAAEDGAAGSAEDDDSDVVSAGPAAVGRLVKGTVAYVVDGDTIHVSFADGTREKVRLIGIDTPESTIEVEQYGKEASAFTKRELFGKTVWLEQDAEERDRYGRLLAYVWTDKPANASDPEIRAKMFNARLAISGYAQQMTIAPNVRYADSFREYVREAREADRGLWALPAEDSGTSGSGSGASRVIAGGFIANSNSRKFHKSDCEWGQKVSARNRVDYGTREAVIADGYVPCKVCDP